jgi:shikimate dehydrogenase
VTDDQLISGRFAVVGNPIEHSLSPRIHAAFARQGRRQIDYRAERVEVDNFESWVSAFFNTEGCGLNVTLPFKTRAFDMADTVSERARLTGAANLLTANEAGGIHADNTDGKGLLTDVTANAGWTLEGARILMLGAGGAVKGVIPSLLDAGPAALVIANRTAERAEALVAQWAAQPIPVSGGGYAQALGTPWDVIINGTSTGLYDEMPALPSETLLAEGCRCYDMAYGKCPTPFMRWAADQGAPEARDGLGMLVEQAAESFYLWLGEYPDTQPVIAHLRQHLAPFDQVLPSR